MAEDPRPEALLPGRELDPGLTEAFSDLFDEDLSPEDVAEAMQALQLLDLLAGAVLDDGVPDRSRVTWPETGRARAPESHDAAKRAQVRLEAAERRLRTLVQQIPAVTFMAMLGEGENEIYVSPHVEQLLGWSQEEWLADPFLWYWRLHPEDRVLWNQEFSRGVRTGGPFKAECRFIAKDGHTVWVHGEARIIRDALGRPEYLQGVAFDITESKAAQALSLRTAVEGARIDEEKAIARHVQTAILPTTFAIEGLDVKATMEPAAEVGGDFYDVHPTGDGPGAWLVIGDVSGHGLDSGLVMLMAQSSLAGLVRARPEAHPSEVIALLNEVLFENIRARLGDDHYITLCLLRYRPDGKVEFAGAHEHILVWRQATGKVERILTPGVWLGLRAQIGHLIEDSWLELAPGDVMVLFTDGLIEATNDFGEMLDMDRLVELIETCPVREAEAVRDRVLRGLVKWSRQPADDVSLLVAKYGEG